MEESRIIECCPTDKMILRCKCCCKEKYYSISYFFLKGLFAFFQLLFTLGLYYFDIVSDIIVLLDLEKSNSEYFSLCLVILLLPTFYALTNQKWTLPINFYDLRDTSCFDRIKTIIQAVMILFCSFLFNVLQLHVVLSACMNFKNYARIDFNGQKLLYIDVRLTESLLESAPQSLFQLFLILQNVASYTYDQITLYYLSISVSILSLVVSLVSYEVTYFNNKRNRFLVKNINYSITNRVIDTKNEYFYIKSEFNSKIGGIHMDGLKNDNLFDIRYKFLKKNTRYIGLLFLYRLTEVKSRIGLLATIGNIYNGYYIIIFLFCDFFISTMANICESIKYPKICEKKFEEYIEASYQTNRILNQVSENDCRLKLRIYCTHFIELLKVIFSPQGLLSVIKFLVKQLKGLAVFNHYFSYYIYNETFSLMEYATSNISEMAVRQNAIRKHKRQEVFKVIFKNHFVSRYLNNLCLSIFIIYNLSVNTYSDSIFLISIGSIVSFIFNIFLWRLIVLYTRNYLKYDYIFTPITCGKCRCCYEKCGCKCCEKKETNNQIEIIYETKELELDDICGKKKDETKKKYQEDIII